jgi:hypothetical protein
MATERCNHAGSTFYRPLGDGFERVCERCHLAASGPTIRKAGVAFLKARLIAGEKLTPAQENTVAFSPAPYGTAASCCPSSVVIAVGEA